MQEKRRYVRMNTVFPVEFEILNESGEKGSSGLLQGFTRDVSAGGLCIEFKSITPEAETELLASHVSLSLTINPVFSVHPIKAFSRIAWLKKEAKLTPARYLIGVEYTGIDPKARNRLIRYARQLQWVPRLAATAGLLMLAIIAGLFVHSQKLVDVNRRLVNQLVESAGKKSDIAADLEGLKKREEKLDRELAEAHGKIGALEASIASLTIENISRKKDYENELGENLARQKMIDQELKRVQEGRKKLEESYKNLQETERVAAPAAHRQMYAWLKSHQNLHTGLVESFEGDPALEDWAFTYDQSLVCQAFLLFGDTRDAAAILSFYDGRASKDEGAFSNAYNTVDGRPTENTVHVGPNVWLGVAALQYQHQIKDGRFLPLAVRIGEWAISLQDQDVEGGLRGGPKFNWYSTEHNLDAYAFFHMLYKETGDKKYEEAASKVLTWIKKYAYSIKENRLNRGKGDATISTDTFSWALAAIGPKTLKEMEFDPEAIMTFAEKNCEVSVSYVRPDGSAGKVKGFDFSKAQNIGRGGVISTEWTAQMIVSYQKLARYFASMQDSQKAQTYFRKADFYLNELQKLIITSPSRTGQGRGCLPYASTDNVDTGHGWRTPKGATTGSVSGTAYGLFAWQHYNPFELENKKVDKSSPDSFAGDQPDDSRLKSATKASAGPPTL